MHGLKFSVPMTDFCQLDSREAIYEISVDPKVKKVKGVGGRVVKAYSVLGRNLPCGLQILHISIEDLIPL